MFSCLLSGYQRNDKIFLRALLDVLILKVLFLKGNTSCLDYKSIDHIFPRFFRIRPGEIPADFKVSASPSTERILSRHRFI